MRFSLRTLTLGLVGLLLLGGGLGIGAAVMVDHRVEQSQERWHAYRDASSVRARALVEITDNLGYGGAIHHLLNYVLRGDQKYLDGFTLAIGAVRSAVDRYWAIDVSPQEYAALEEIDELVSVLVDRAEQAQVMRAYGNPVQETARAMALWSPGALEALDDLNNAVSGRRSHRTGHLTKLELLRELRRAVGFGGMIDFFKKLVLLGDPAFAPLARRGTEVALQTIENYRELPLTPAESAALERLEETLRAYEVGIVLAQVMAEDGASANHIDQAVIVDDTPALVGLATLERSIEREAGRLKNEIEDNLHSVTEMTDLLIAVFSVGAAIVSLIIVGVILNSVERPLSKIADAMVRIPEGDLAAIGPVESRVREVADLAGSLDVFRTYASELDKTSGVLQRFQELSTDVSLSVDERIERILHLGVEHFGTDLGTASCTTSGQYVVAFSVSKVESRKPGTSFELETTYCSHTLKAGKALAYHNIEDSPLADEQCYRTFGRKAYIGAPVIVDGEVFGTINFSSLDARDTPFTKSDLILVEMMGRWLGVEFERERAMERLAAAKDAAEEGTRAKSSFLANMSHEIRTPLNGIIGLSRLLAQTALGAKQRDYVRKVLFSSENLLGIINDILDFSKIEAGQLTIETTDFRLLDVIEGVSAIVAPRAAEKNLEFLVSVDPNTPQDLVGDPLRLGQILTNLCTNAIKFTEEGEIIVSVRATEVSDGRAELHFSVRDTGVGMTEEQVGQIFRPFTQADVSTTRKFGGTGLGLTISKEFAERMGGRIWVESEQDLGSTFQFTVNLALGAAGEAGPTVLPSDLRNLRILVVDDNEMARLVIGDTLRTMGFEVDVAASGQAAVRRVSSDNGELSYNIVLMDWMMPGLDGIEAARQIREKLGDGPQPSTILVSAYMPDEGVLDQAGGDLSGYVSKPVNQSTLFDAIASAVGSRSGLTYSRSSEPSRSATSLGGLVVLLAEDNEINQEVAVSVLQQQGVKVDIASNGQEALDRLTHVGPEHYDAVLMDVQMPIMDGLEATRRIKSDAKFADLPVIAMTAHALEEERQRCFAAGMCDHVAKPLDEEKLFEALSRHCTADRRDRSGVQDGEVEADGKAPAVMAAPTMLDLDRLTRIDVESLRRALPDDALTSRLLLKFREGQGSAVADLTRAVEEGRSDDARRIAHQVRGIAGNLRALDVLEAAKDLEHRIDLHGLDDRKTLQELSETFAASLDALFADIDQAVAQPQDPSTEPQTAPAEATLSPTAIKTLIDELRTGDMKAEDTWADLAPALRARDEAQADAVAASIDDLDYDAAAGKLESLLSLT